MKNQTMRNQTIRNDIKAAGVFQWELAEALGVSEYTLVRFLRQDLTEEKKKKIYEALEKVKAEKVD